MKTILLTIALFVASGDLPWPVYGADAAEAQRAKLYDESADGAKQVTQALVVAKKAYKHVLLEFGANWCGWCLKLHKLFESDRAIIKTPPFLSP